MLLFLFIAAAAATLVPPAYIPRTWPNLTSSTLDLPLTDSSTISKTALIIDQKSGAAGSPNHPVQNPSVTAVDGKLVSNPKSTRDLSLPPRSLSTYQLVFNGSANPRDAAIQGTAYLTFAYVSNATYNVDDCLRFCDSVPACSTSQSNPPSIPLTLSQHSPTYIMNSPLPTHPTSNAYCTPTSTQPTKKPTGATTPTSSRAQAGPSNPSPTPTHPKDTNTSLGPPTLPMTLVGYLFPSLPLLPSQLTTYAVHGLCLPRPLRRLCLCPGMQQTQPRPCRRCLPIL